MSNLINILLLAAFLIINLGFGLYYGKGVRNITDYALGNRNFSTGVLVSTIVATWIGGDYLFITIEEVYNKGLHYVIACCGMAVQLVVITYFFVPRMGEFLGNISIAEAVGQLYGKEIRILAAITGSIAAIGLVAVQFKVFGSIFKYFFGMQENIAIVISAAITIFYSAFGGIRSVTFTDVIQFFTFGVLIPVIAIVIWIDVYNLPNFSAENIIANPLFNWEEFVGYNNPKFWKMFCLFIYFVLPGFEPAVFQRIAIGRSVRQVKQAFYIAAFILLLILLGMAWIGFLLANLNPDLPSNELVYYILDNYGQGGLKSFILLGIVAMCMSSADSQINSAAVLLAHDFCKPLNIGLRSELFNSKLLSVVIGGLGIKLALSDKGLLEIVFITQTFYMPIICVPFMLAILGFRTTKSAAIIAIAVTAIAMITWSKLSTAEVTGADSLLIGCVVNLVVLISAHYLLKQPGGWIGNKNNHILEHDRLERKYKFNKFKENLKNFNLIKFCVNNAPHKDLTYLSFGVFAAISSFCTIYSISTELGKEEVNNLIYFYKLMFVVSFCFITYPIWPAYFKRMNFIAISWFIGITYLLIFSSVFFLIKSNFSHLQFVVFTVNIIVVAIITRWQFAFIMILIGSIASMIFYKYYYGFSNILINGDSTPLIYISFLLSGATVLIFLKPQQDYQALTEEKAEHLGSRILKNEEELQKLTELKYEFLRNIEHEINTPITGIVSLGQALIDNYEKLDEPTIKAGLETIAKSSERFDSLVKNLLNLSKLNSLSFELHKQDIDVSNLIFNRLNICKKLYLDNKPLEFKIDLERNVIVNCDEYYIISAIDNLIINAITYSKIGLITVSLKYHSKDEVIFSITDEGIGIPENELVDIFGAFVVSNKTKTPAGGRGIGLAICKKVINVHKGSIWAENNNNKGIIFKFILPIRYKEDKLEEDKKTNI